MYVDVWSIIANQERQVSSVEKLSKMKLVKPSPRATFFLTYFKVSNAVLKMLLKTKIRLQALLKII
jgi:hypothetical protein